MTDDIELHGRRCAWLCAQLCTELGMPTTEILDIARAALTHDIGKYALPAALLDKQTRLAPDEYTLIRRHCVMGAQRLIREASQDTDESSTTAVAVALSHHEWWNGQGYPFGLSGEAIPRCARVVAVADVFDALLSHRPYKAAWDLPAALDYIGRHRGTQFDPECVDALLAFAGDLPPAWKKVAEDGVHLLLEDLKLLGRHGSPTLLVTAACAAESSRYSA